MRAYLTEALKRRKSDEGFSLIELIVVVAILAILVAIAVPIFMNVQQQAKDNALATITANAATQTAASIAQGKIPAQGADPADPVDSAKKFFINLTADTDPTVTLTLAYTADKELDTFCVTGSQDGTTEDMTSGPGCTS